MGGCWGSVEQCMGERWWGGGEVLCEVGTQNGAAVDE